MTTTVTKPAPLPKPATADDVDHLWTLAEQLAGRPVPGVRMTEKEFEAWCDEDVNAEWIDGQIVLIPPATYDHADLAGWLACVLGGFVEHHDLGAVVNGGFMVRLPCRRRVPDLLYVSKRRAHLFRPMFFDGAPDLVVEIVSPDSQSRDYRDKYAEYERAGVREYWIADPTSARIEGYGLGKKKRYARLPEAEGRIVSAVLPGFYFRPDWLGREKLPRVGAVLKELGVRR